MTTKTKRQSKQASEPQKTSISTRPTIEQVNKMFCAGVKVKDDDNTKNTLETFLRVADDLRQNSRSFTWQDFINRAKSYELDLDQCKVLFDRWIITLHRASMIKIVDGCYDSLVFANV